MPQPFLIPIIAKKPIIGVSARAVVSRMSKLGFDIVRAAANYPTPRTRYRRRGRLGQSWTKAGPQTRGKDLVVTVGNKMRYARAVMGMKSGPDAQMARFKTLGWRSIQEIGETEVKEAQPAIERLLQGK